MGCLKRRGWEWKPNGGRLDLPAHVFVRPGGRAPAAGGAAIVDFFPDPADDARLDDQVIRFCLAARVDGRYPDDEPGARVGHVDEPHAKAATEAAVAARDAAVPRDAKRPRRAPAAPTAPAAPAPGAGRARQAAAAASRPRPSPTPTVADAFDCSATRSRDPHRRATRARAARARARPLHGSAAPGPLVEARAPVDDAGGASSRKTTWRPARVELVRDDGTVDLAYVADGAKASRVRVGDARVLRAPLAREARRRGARRRPRRRSRSSRPRTGARRRPTSSRSARAPTRSAAAPCTSAASQGRGRRSR